MASQVLWTIDNELDGASFERLCVDLLYRNGYCDIDCRFEKVFAGVIPNVAVAASYPKSC